MKVLPMPYFNPQTGRFEHDEINLDQFDPNMFADELIAGADIDDTSKEALRKVLGNTTVSSRLKNAVSLRSVAQRTMDQSRNLAREAESLREANYEWVRDNKTVIEAWARSRGGNTTVTTPSGDTLTKSEALQLVKDELKAARDEFSAQLAQQDESYVGLLADTVSLTQRWTKLFPAEEFPYGELQKFALTKRMTLSNAFDKFIEPKMEEKRTADLERIKKESYEQGKLDALSSREEITTAEEGGDLSRVFGDALLGRRTQTLTNSEGKALSGEDAFVASWKQNNGFKQVNH